YRHLPVAVASLRHATLRSSRRAAQGAYACPRPLRSSRHRPDHVCYTRFSMTTRAIAIYGLAAVWCAATAVKAVIVLARREAYVASGWDAGVAGTGRKFGTARTAIKLVMMLAIATTCGLALAQVIVQPLSIYLILGAIGVTAIAELSAPKPKRR